MNAYRTRRATSDDLAQLAGLWQAARLPAAELGKRFTDFQVAEDEQGLLAAAIGLHVEGSQGRIHSEALANPALAGDLRPVLWQRMQVVAKNHGLFRLWTEEAAAWWKEGAGFSAATAEALQRLPESYGPPQAAWLTLRLRDETLDPGLLDKALAMYREAEKGRREAFMRRGRILTLIGTVLAALFFFIAITLLFYVVKHRR